MIDNLSNELVKINGKKLFNECKRDKNMSEGKKVWEVEIRR